MILDVFRNGHCRFWMVLRAEHERAFQITWLTVNGWSILKVFGHISSTGLYSELGKTKQSVSETGADSNDGMLTITQNSSLHVLTNNHAVHSVFRFIPGPVLVHSSDAPGYGSRNVASCATVVPRDVNKCIYKVLIG